MKVITFPYGPLGANMYVVELADEYVLIDPSVNPDKILSSKRVGDDFLSKVSAILITHAHFDHILYVDKWSDLLNVPVYIDKKDAPFLSEPEMNCSSQMMADTMFCTKTVSLDDSLSFGDTKIRIIRTPGHTPGSVCYLFENERIMFSGDMLFAGAVGRVDLPLGNDTDMINSIKLLKTLDDDILVYPGHGYYTKMEIEKKSNPFFNF